MFTWFKGLFAAKPVVDLRRWEEMEERDPLLSYSRFEALELTERQRPLVQGLIDGTVKPAECAAVGKWKKQSGESDEGTDALMFALQHAMGGVEVTYLFEDQAPVPIVRFPDFVDERTLTLLFNDREGHLQITSLEEFLSLNNISNYTLEALDLDQLRRRMAGRTSRPRERQATSTTNPPSRGQGRPPSITIERKANAEGRLDETVGVAEITSALNHAGFNVTSDEVCLESPIEKLGLYNVLLRTGRDADSKVYVWVVPSVEHEESEG